jgi:hypothetical protein
LSILKPVLGAHSDLSHLECGFAPEYGMANHFDTVGLRIEEHCARISLRVLFAWAIRNEHRYSRLVRLINYVRKLLSAFAGGSNLFFSLNAGDSTK